MAIILNNKRYSTSLLNDVRYNYTAVAHMRFNFVTRSMNFMWSILKLDRIKNNSEVK